MKTVRSLGTLARERVCGMNRRILHSVGILSAVPMVPTIFDGQLTGLNECRGQGDDASSGQIADDEETGDEPSETLTIDTSTLLIQ